MSHQAMLFLTTVGVGIIIGLVYDLFRILRKTAPHNALFVQAEDLLFWLAVTLFMFYFMLNRNFGEIRLFSVLGAVLGTVLYFATVSVLVMKVSVAALNFLKRVIATAVSILLAPFRLLAKLLAPPIKWCGARVNKGLRLAGRYAKMKAKKTVKSLLIIRKKV